MRFGARNQIRGRVTAIKRGRVMGQVTVDVLEPPTMTSVMTVDSIDDLGIARGCEVLVLVKGVNVLLAHASARRPGAARRRRAPGPRPRRRP